MAKAGQTVRMSQRGTVTIPKELRKGLNDNTLLEIVRREDGVIELRPRVPIDPSQSWFWTERWQKMELEADEAYAAGRYRIHDSTEDFISALEEHGPVEHVPPPAADDAG